MAYFATNSSVTHGFKPEQYLFAMARFYCFRPTYTFLIVLFFQIVCSYAQIMHVFRESSKQFLLHALADSQITCMTGHIRIPSTRFLTPPVNHEYKRIASEVTAENVKVKFS